VITIILGAGITGLSAGWATAGTIYEATDKPGGICRSYYKDIEGIFNEISQSICQAYKQGKLRKE